MAMTTRLLARWARFLGSRGLRAASRETCLPAGPVHSTALAPAEPLWAQALSVHPRARALCEDHGPSKRTDEDTAALRHTALGKLAEKATSPQEILQLWANRGANANHTALCIIQLVHLATEKGTSDHAALLQDPRLQDMFNLVSSQVRRVWNGSLVSLLRALTLLNTAPDTHMLASLQMEALWRVRRFSYRQLAYLYEWACSQGGPQAEELRDAVVKQLELRWTELGDGRTVAMLMSRAAELPLSLVDKLEDKALELVEHFRAKDIRKVVLVLASQGRRSVPLFRAFSYHIQQKPSQELKTPLLLDLIYAYAKVNFHHGQVFQRISAELLPHVAQLSPGDVTRSCRSYSHLKWLDLPLFEGFAQHYIEHCQKYTTPQLCSLLLSFAQLNFLPEKKEQFFGKVHAALEGALLGLEPILLTDVVWSLCVLQQAKPTYVKVVLDPAFQHRLSGAAPPRAAGHNLKLQHIAAAAQLETLCPLPEAMSGPGVQAPPFPDSQPTPLQCSLHEALHSLVGGLEEARRTGVSTVYGWTIDGELVVDSESKPVNLLRLRAPHLAKGGGVSPLPKGAHRIAFLAREFSHFDSKNKELLGRYCMQRRHLQLAGFLVVEVPYYEWVELKDDRQRVSYLKDKMGKAVGEEMAK